MGEHGLEPTSIERRLFRLRGELVILDSDLATLYGVPTKKLNQQVGRHRNRFPLDFMFQVNAEEFADLRANGALPRTHGGRRYRPYVFTELGAGMLASIFRGRKAALVSVELIRAFGKQYPSQVGPPPEPGKRTFDAIRDAFLMSDSEARFATKTPVTYFLQAGKDGPIKIGSTRNLAVRLRSLATMSPIPLTLLAVVGDDIEDQCHEILAAYRLHGEWFAPAPAVLAFIRERAASQTRRASVNPQP